MAPDRSDWSSGETGLVYLVSDWAHPGSAIPAGAGPVWVCLQALPGLLPAEPAGPQPGAGGRVAQVWRAGPEWFLDMRERLGEAAHLRVVLPWPVPSAVETALLLERLRPVTWHLAVPLDLEDPEAQFHWMGALGYPWTALPPAPAALDRALEPMRELARLWLCHPRSRVWIEPVALAFQDILGERLGGAPQARRLTALRDGGAGAQLVASGLPWAPSQHAVLTSAPEAWLEAGALEALAAWDEAWGGELRRLAADLP